MKITIYNKLKKYEGYLQTAKYGNFIRGLNCKQVQELSDIGNEIGIPYKHNGCPKCMLDFIKKLAEPYFKQKDNLEQKRKDKENENKR